MKVEDIRVGDFVVVNNNRIHKIKSIDTSSEFIILYDNKSPDDLTVCISDIKPVYLEEILMDIIGLVECDKSFIKSNLEKDATVYSIYCFDSVIHFTRDWNTYPSYHVGVRYTDSPFSHDEGQIYNFFYNICYIHELQNIVNLMKSKDDACYNGNHLNIIIDNLNNPDLFKDI